MEIRRILTTIDSHAGGEPLRLITSGIPRLRGRTILERKSELAEQHDHLRQTLMWEPRGHADMYGAILTDPVTSDADYGILFLHNEGYSTMCGHGIIAVTTILLETGMFPVEGEETVIGYDSPAGFIEARARIDGNRVQSVAFTNVPSFVQRNSLEITTSLGEVEVSIAYGGAFYALVDGAKLGLAVESSQIEDLIRAGMEIKRAIDTEFEIVHPLEPGIHGMYGTIIYDDPVNPDVDGRNVTIFADGEVDRSPCGTGTAARVAWMHSRGELDAGQPYIHESITGTRFTGKVLETTRVADRRAVIPEIAGQGFITGYHTFVAEAEDPLGTGFLLR